MNFLNYCDLLKKKSKFADYFKNEYFKFKWVSVYY